MGPSQGSRQESGEASAAKNYASIGAKPWKQILSEDTFEYAPPHTVHLPIQPVHSRDLVHVDAGLNVCRKRVFEKLTSRDLEACQAAAAHELFVVELALGDPPFVPDFRRSEMELAEGRYPVARASYFALELYYEFEYFCRRLDDGQTLLWICGCVTSDAETARAAHVRAKVNFQRECDLYDYHYVPFYWDNSKWPACDSVSLAGESILRGGNQIGKVVPGDFSAVWEARAHFEADAYNSEFGCGRPYFVPPHLQLNDVDDVIHFQATLEPEERKTFAMALLVGFEEVSDSHRAFLAAANAGDDRAAALSHFEGQLTAAHAQVVFPLDHLADRFVEFQTSTLQLLIGFAGADDLMPTQGGSSERHFVWVWEAMNMLVPMLKLGHFAVVKKALDFIFSLQDGGYPPEGRFTTLEGAIGTTGPRWINSTGSALGLAAEYWRYSRDERFPDEYLPRMMRAATWIAGELRATRRLNDDGTRPPYYGLLPFGCGTDGDTGYIVGFSDSYTFWGLERTVLMLEAMGDERAVELRCELEEYRANIARAVEHMTREDGFVDRKILTGEDERIARQFERIGSAIRMTCTGCADVREPRWRRFVEFFETNWADGYFLGRLDRESKYIGAAEFIWQHAYMALGEWKKAFAAMRVNVKYGMTQDTYQTQERFSTREPAYTCWQPNGSGNGRAIEMTLRLFWFEYDGVVTVLGGLPFEYLRQNGTTALRGMYTPAGRVSLDAVASGDGQHCTVRLSGALPRRLRFPDFLSVRCDAPGVRSCGEGEYEIAGSADCATFSVAENPEA